MVPLDFLPKDLSAAQQFILNIALFIGVVIGVAVNFLKSSKRPPAAPVSRDDVVIQSASIADMRPVREAGHQLAELVKIQHDHLRHMETMCGTWRGILEEVKAIRVAAADIARENEVQNRSRDRDSTAHRDRRR